MKFFIIHGSYGNPNENWIPWLKESLEKEGNEVIVPQFPLNENQNLENWMNVIKPYFNHINSQTIFIGHSIGPAFILSILEKIKTNIRACFLVSGFLGLLNNEKFDEVNKIFTTKDFDWKKIKENCRNFYIFHSDNDPYVPFEKAERLSKKLNVKVIVIPNGGHLNTSAGYTRFPELLNKIKEELN